MSGPKNVAASSRCLQVFCHLLLTSFSLAVLDASQVLLQAVGRSLEVVHKQLLTEDIFSLIPSPLDYPGSAERMSNALLVWWQRASMSPLSINCKSAKKPDGKMPQAVDSLADFSVPGSRAKCIPR